MPLSPVTIFDTFSRGSSGSWGTSESGHAWTGATGSLFDAFTGGGGYGVLRSPVNASLVTPTIRLSSYNIAEQTTSEILTKVKITATAEWPLTDFGPILSDANGSRYYFAIQSNWSELAIGVWIKGYRYEIVRTSFPIVKNQSYWVRFERHASGVRGKIWKEGTAEPSGWTLSTTLWDGSNPPAAGSPGFYRMGTRDSYDVQVHAFYFYTKEDTEGSNLPSDQFTGRTSTAGWGLANSGHVWEGSVADDPATFGYTVSRGNVNPGIAGFIAGASADTFGYEPSGLLGPSRGGDIEHYARVWIGTAPSGTGNPRVGIRGQVTYQNGRAYVSGYFAQIKTGSQELGIWYRDTSGNYTSVAFNATALPAVVNPSMIYRIRFQVVGTTFNARAWIDGAAEPTSWQASGTSTARSSGRHWLSGVNGAAVERQYYWYFSESLAPTFDTPVTINYLTTGAVTIANTTATTINISAAYTNDSNANSSISVRYKPTSATSWISFTDGYTTVRPSKLFLFQVTGLQPATSYNIEVTYQDVDSVFGPNPVSIVASTNSEGLRSQSIKVTSVTTSSIGIEASYLLDTDSDSSATLDYRLTTAEVSLVADYFVDEDDGVYLQNIDSSVGDWVKHPTMTQTVQAITLDRRVYAITALPTDKMLYYHTQQTPTTDYEVVANFFAVHLEGYQGIAGRVDATTETYYGAGIDAVTQNWELFKVVSGTKTVLDSSPFNTDIGVIHEFRLSLRDAYKTFSVNGEEILRTQDNSIASQGYAGYYLTGVTQGRPTNQFVLEDFSLRYRTAAGSWTSSGAMTANRTNKTFSKTVTGLLMDRVYEFRVTFTDPDGVTGVNTLLITAQTTGQAIGLSSIGATPFATSAIIDIFYNYDSNDNSYVEFQYKSIFDYLWTTIPFTKFQTDRDIGKFTAILTGLSARTTYEVKAIPVDPEGLMVGTPSSLSGLFTTLSFNVVDEKQHKHFLWKVYDGNDQYLGTIPDAPEPEFSLHANGGVTDLSIKLARKINEVEASKLIQFQNRVDVWAIDPSSNGMGPNMIVDADCDAEVGAWTHSIISSYDATGGPDGGSALRIQSAAAAPYETLSNPIEIGERVPLVVSCVARGIGSKLRLYVQSYDINDINFDSSDETAETVGTDWQTLRIEYLPPESTAYIRVTVRNMGRGTMWADKFSVLPKELMIYRGHIEAYTPEVTENGEEVTVEILGLASLMSDDYIEFAQFVEIQPAKDIEAQRPNFGAKDPADMMKIILDMARTANPKFRLYYTAESIRYTGELVQYTFRDQQVRSCMDKIRTLCPSGWHYYIEADGLVILRGPEHAATHKLRLGVEVMRFSIEKSIRNLKNYIKVKGRQDEDKSEPDGFGSINYIAFDQKSIDKYGKRMAFIRDAQVTDPDTAKKIGDGRLDEMNREEQRAECYIPDEKDYNPVSGSLRGYNIEAFRPGDNILIFDPVGGARNSYWDQLTWDEDAWDMSNVFTPLPDTAPIITVQHQGNYAQLELSERPPSQVGDFSRLYRWLASRDQD